MTCRVMWALPAMPCHAIPLVGLCWLSQAIVGLTLLVNVCVESKQTFDHLTEIKKYGNHFILS